MGKTAGAGGGTRAGRSRAAVSEAVTPAQTSTRGLAGALAIANRSYVSYDDFSAAWRGADERGRSVLRTAIPTFANRITGPHAKEKKSIPTTRIPQIPRDIWFNPSSGKKK